MIIKSFQKHPSLLKAAVFGGNDGIITTFAVVSGAAGAGLSPHIVVIMGVANIAADALSMGLGDYLGEKSERRMQKRNGDSSNPEPAWASGLVTFICFMIAGVVPLTPFLLEIVGVQLQGQEFLLSSLATGVGLFVIGSSRAFITGGSWFRNGIEMLGIGAIAAVVAYGLGALIEGFLQERSF